MAGRTGAGVGIVVTISLLGVTTVTFLVLSIFLWAEYQETSKELAATEAVNNEIIRPDEREIGGIRDLQQQANRENKTLVRYLVDSRRDTMGLLSGFPEDSLEDVRQRADALELRQGPDGSDQSLGGAIAASGSVFGVIQDLRSERDDLLERAADAEDAADLAEGELDQRTQEFEQFRSSQLAAVSSLQAQIGDLAADAQQYREGIRQAEVTYATKLQDLEQDAVEVERTLLGRIENLDQQNLILQDTLSRLRKETESNRIQPRSEAALVDGSVVGVNAADREVFVSLGSSDNVVLGMTFTVYADATQIRPNIQGIYPAGKATIEIISISDDSSRARILTEVRGNPIVANDVIANAAYDPDKVYKFMVLGNFATAGSKVATPAGADEIRALLDRWGGEVIDELTGDLDFLVLGARPRVPQDPPVDAPIEVFEEFRRQERKTQEYDRMLEYARATSVPVLNQNRLYTLIGGGPARTR